MEVVKPTGILSVTLICIGILEFYFIEENSINRFLIVFSSLIIIGLSQIFILLKSEERLFIINTIKKLIRKN